MIFCLQDSFSLLFDKVMENRAKIDNIVIENKKKDTDFTDWCNVTFKVGHDPNANCLPHFIHPLMEVFHLQEYFDKTSDKIYERMESFEKLMNVSISCDNLNEFELNSIFNSIPILYCRLSVRSSSRWWKMRRRRLRNPTHLWRTSRYVSHFTNESMHIINHMHLYFMCRPPPFAR